MSELKDTRVNGINKLICPLFDIEANIKKVKLPENIKFGGLQPLEKKTKNEKLQLVTLYIPLPSIDDQMPLIPSSFVKLLDCCLV